MLSRLVKFYREPAGSKTNPRQLDIDLLDLSHAAAKESLQTGVATGAWLDLFQSVLTSEPQLRWHDQGMGRGRELKRSFSNILGRFLARHYLECHEGVIELVPIEGNNYKFGEFVVRRKIGRPGDLPDWVGCTGNGLVIAEAKGSHDTTDWGKKARRVPKKPSVIQNAMAQVERVEIVAPDNSSRSIVFKGWSIGARWATVKNGLDPWLMAIDPKQGKDSLAPKEFEDVKRAILKHSNLLMLRSMGFMPPSYDEESESATEPYYSRSAFFAVRGTGELEIPRSLHAVAGPFGFLPIKSQGNFRYFVGIARRYTGQFALISLSEDRLNGKIKSSEAIRRGGKRLERNGFTLTFIDRDTSLKIAG